MKKRIMVIILAATLGAAVITGCGDNTELRIRGKALWICFLKQIWWLQ